MRILHFSDIHLDKNNLKKSQRIVDNILDALTPIQKQSPVDLVIFSGDILDKGGESFDDITQGFDEFRKIISQLLDFLKLSPERFIFCPGNHDIKRSLDNKYAEIGLVLTLTDADKLSEFYDNPDPNCMQRVRPFKEFEKNYYEQCDKNSLEYYPSNFQSNFILNINGRRIGITALNSSWRCYNSSEDKGRILMCASQIITSEKRLKHCDIKIALSHHSYTWMNEFEILKLEKLITQEYDMYFTGHTHSSDVEYCIRPEGKTFKIVAPGTMCANINETGKYRNGFSIVDFNVDKAYVETSLYIQDELLQHFTLDKNHGEDGVWHVDIPLGEEQKKNRNIQEVILGMKEELGEINHHLLSYDKSSSAPKSFNKIFVMPTITERITTQDIDNNYNEEIEEREIESIESIIELKDNVIIFGIKESGKTVLLDRLLLEFLNKNNGTEMLPAYIKFSSIKTDIKASIMESWHQNKVLTESLISKCKIVLLIDDIVFSDLKRLDIVKDFLLKHENARLIGTCLEAKKNDLILDAYSYSGFNYKRVELNEFNSRQIRTLADNWIGDAEDKYKKIEFLIKVFSNVGLPRTPFAISMFLWILERQDCYKPQNNAILIKQFLESLLQSNEQKGALREQFDYINKCSLLSVIAKNMLDNNNLNYLLPTSSVIEIIEKHFSDLEFTFYNARKVLDNFLQLGIFVEDGQGNIMFRFTCFFEYFLYLYMEKSKDFKCEVLKSENFSKYYNEIVFYTGINRGETEILNKIIEELEYRYIDINSIVEEKVSNIDDIFTVRQSFLQSLTADDLQTVLPDKQTQEDKDRENDIKLSTHDDLKQQGVIKKKQSDKFSDYSKILLLSMNVLRNLEEVKEDGLKKSCYAKILKNSISYLILFKLICDEMISHADQFQSSRIADLKICRRLLPVLHEELLKDYLGTFKLTHVIKDKIEKDSVVKPSELEQFMSVFLYVDLKGGDYKSILDSFINRFNRSYIADACFFKLSGYYYTSNDTAQDSVWLNALSDMYIKVNKTNKSNSRLDKSKVMSNFRQRKKQKEIMNKRKENDHIR